ncbi:GNAT family N-acetyltransferase [Rufibacter glacialis]|uniref:GNAT family N-acetyltransferase n=1 Tax=Rufibacter glacialis TaxID=1259555 RepID=A0A5M8Q752_9BACT|nr:GNAT family N-acetyltransferase [Rufibacter glacialis]KAA6431717.1 GNAT family N-acetyltransferase [Rufibacter glacialis]GGK82161.1 hypothetical protein GCM10011405_32420 [Rufibacter glacialis]
MPAHFQIKEIPAAQTWPVRHEVMWPDKPESFVRLPEDEAGIHFGLFVEQQLVSVLSLFLYGEQAQFRKFCTLPAFQKKGFGAALLQHVLAFASVQGACSIWCHARASARSFYQKAGLQEKGEVFRKNDLAYVKMVFEVTDPRRSQVN